MADFAADTKPLVVADAVSKRYGPKTVLSDFSLSLCAGEAVALLGHNGAGKTTLLKLLLGVTRPSGGSARVFGRDPTRMPAALRQQWGYLPENVAFHGAMTGREVLRFYTRLKGESVTRVSELLERVGLADAADRRVNTYSKGMRQRLGLAQALLGAPRMLFLDEPTTGLDPFLRRAFYAIVEERRQAGCAVLICTHTLAEVEERVSRVAILDNGRLVVSGTMEELRARASLPTRVRVKTRPGAASKVREVLNEAIPLDHVNDSMVTLRCADRDKLRIVARVARHTEWVEDVELTPPRLEDLYAHFLEGAKQP